MTAKHEIARDDILPMADYVRERKERRVTLAAVKKALDEGDTATAGTTFRRLWRRFSPAVQNRFMRFYSPPAVRMVWPKDKKEIEKDKAKREAEAKKSKKKRPRGGLPEMLTRELTPKEKRRSRGGHRGGYTIIDGMMVPIGQDDDKKKVVTAHSVLVQHEFGRREIQRQLRSLPAAFLGTIAARDIYKALVSLEVEKFGCVVCHSGRAKCWPQVWPPGTPYRLPNCALPWEPD
ncbi:MAG: hypothetical protein IH971_09965 [Candidatus Marinimicrobia bacterium]|nr:hypothetical protein [Candidatus Neomarinimicrobiota bacterium]